MEEEELVEKIQFGDSTLIRIKSDSGIEAWVTEDFYNKLITHPRVIEEYNRKTNTVKTEN